MTEIIFCSFGNLEIGSYLRFGYWNLEFQHQFQYDIPLP
jgi:hypothetical protein